MEEGYGGRGVWKRAVERGREEVGEGEVVDGERGTGKGRCWTWMPWQHVVDTVHARANTLVHMHSLDQATKHDEDRPVLVASQLPMRQWHGVCKFILDKARHVAYTHDGDEGRGTGVGCANRNWGGGTRRTGPSRVPALLAHTGVRTTPALFKQQTAPFSHGRG